MWRLHLGLGCKLEALLFLHGKQNYIPSMLILIFIMFWRCSLCCFWSSSCCWLLFASVHHVVDRYKCLFVLFLIASAHCVVEIHCVINAIHHVTFPFYEKYYLYPYIVLQVEISLEVKVNGCKASTKTFSFQVCSSCLNFNP